MVYRITDAGEERREKRHATIIAVAQRLFALKGVGGTTVQDVVRAAGTSIGNFYFYFANKDQLVSEVVADALRAAYDRAETLMDSLPYGPARMAVITLCNGETLVGSDSVVLPMLRQTGAQVVAEQVVLRNVAFLQKHMKLNFPEQSEADARFNATAWTGVGRGIISDAIGRADMKQSDVDDAMENVIRYNLRALGFSNTEADAAIAEARAVMKP